MRIAFIVETLGSGGAEKQLYYMVRALRQSGASIRLYAILVCPPYDDMIRSLGVDIIPIRSNHGRFYDMLMLIKEIRRYAPHFVQASHFPCNPYAALAARTVDAVDIGAIRNDGLRDVESVAFGGKLYLHCNKALICNSEAAHSNLLSLGRSRRNLFILPNVIDLAQHDRVELSENIPGIEDDVFKVIAVGGMHFPVKRFDVFLKGLSLASQQAPALRGYLIGDGPLRSGLETLATNLGISGIVNFLGQRRDVAAILKTMDVHVLPSDQEGFPNVVLEAMASSLAVVTTRAGDAARLVEEGKTGFIIPFNSPEALAERIVLLYRNRQACKSFGDSGRIRINREYSHVHLAERLGSIYRTLNPQLDNYPKC